MTLQPVAGVFFPDYHQYGRLMNQTITYNAFLLDAAAEKVAFIFRAPKAGTLARVGFRTGTVTTGDVLKVSFQDVSLADGNPDGVVDQFRTQVIADVDDNAWFRTGLLTSDGTDGGAKRAVARGDRLAIVIEFDSFVAGNLNIATESVFGGTAASPFVGNYYVDHFTASWAKNTSAILTFALEYDDGSFAYIPMAFPAATVGTNSFITTSNPDEIALKFRIPFKARVYGFWGSLGIAGDTDIVLYDAGDQVVISESLDKDIRIVNGAAACGVFSSEVTLDANVFYRLAVKPTTAGSGTQLTWFTVQSTPGAAQLDQMSGGQDCHWSERVNGGSWSDTTTKRPCLGLILSALDDGQGGGLSRARVVNAGGM